MSFNLSKSRLETFSDGVIAIIITIMVLDLRIPELPPAAGENELFCALLDLLPGISAYVLSFLVVAILWINHSALFHHLPHTNSTFFWYNSLLLFFMSLIPLPTGLIANYPTMKLSYALYGLVMTCCSVSFYLLRNYAVFGAGLIPYHPGIRQSNLLAMLLYFISIPLAYVSIYLSILIFVLIPLEYAIPQHQPKPKS